ALLKTAIYTDFFIDSLSGTMQAEGIEIEFDADAVERLLGKVGGDIRAYFRENEDQLGQPVSFELAAMPPLSARIFYLRQPKARRLRLDRGFGSTIEKTATVSRRGHEPAQS
ncbi:MAG: hypothetical protein AAFW88_10390, partial [Pseudomonadota bacterium]